MVRTNRPAGHSAVIAAGSGLLIHHGVRRWRFEPGAAVTVGRGEDCDVVLEDPRLSHRHVRISVQAGAWVVEDTGSRNGSWINGRKLRQEPVAGPMELRLGDPHEGVVLSLEPEDVRTDAGRLRHSAFSPSRRAAPAGRTAASISIGRARDNDIVLNDVLVSRHHARVDSTAAGRRVVDLGSRNRTLVNGVPIGETRPVSDGDRITIGGTEFRLECGELRPTAVAVRRLVATDLSVQLPDGRPIVAGVELDVGAGELVAIIGPSGAGKSTLLKLLTGRLKPSSGGASYDGYDVYEQFDGVRSMIGVVPQDDIVHRLLTVRQALSFAAKLRLPDDTDGQERRATIEQVLTELGLTEQARTRIDRLSGGQRKRVSIALELLTSPSLLLLDEPTSGLDPALDRQIMETLRALADGGRTVVVVTHNVAHLSRCDQVLLLAPGGMPVYSGRPSGLLPYFGGDDWADVYSRIVDDPALARRNYVSSGGSGRLLRAAVPATRKHASPVLPTGWRTRLRQARTLAARHLVLIAADRAYGLFLLLLPALLALFAIVVPGSAGLRAAHPTAPTEPGQILVLVFVGAAFAGGAIACREVISERAIVIRERAAGLHPTAYATAKLAVFTVLCAVQSVVLVAGVAVVKPTPAAGVLMGSGRLELAVAVWCTSLASSQLSLLLSALARSAEQAMPLLVVMAMAQLVLCGGLIPVTGRAVVSQLSWAAPARWGYAAGAVTVDLRSVSPGVPADRLWAHSPAFWLLSIVVLLGITTGGAALVSLRIRRMDRI